MARLVSLACPHCGAPLKLPEGADEAVCAYCSHTVLVHRPGQPARVAKNQDVHVVELSGAPLASVGRGLFIAFAIGGVLFAIGIGALVFSLTNAAASLDLSKTGNLASLAQVAQPRFHFSDHPFLFDVNGDGKLDVLGKNNAPGGASWLAAFDGTTGAQLWKSAELSSDASEAGAFRMLASGVLISVDALGKLQAYDAKTGQPAWAGLLGETARHACAGDGFVRIEKSDRTATTLDPATGRSREIQKDTPCKSVPTSRKESNFGQRLVGWSDFRELGLPELHKLPGIAAHRALVLDDEPLAFELGSKEGGTQVAKVAAVRGKEVLWSDLVPGVDPLSTDVNVTTQIAAYASGRLAIPYHMRKSEDGVRLAAFDARSGQRLWDVEVHKKTQVDGGIAMTDDTIFYGSWTALYALDAKTGQRRFVIGNEF